ncbi:uncharacterized protein JCM6883_005630 [Sporobolomyces salmoneus]|uniref:uncharacterized protein n=1 Tax=Sporobolomyces salmoneus TaxID=183962 RepID=UPI0031810361
MPRSARSSRRASVVSSASGWPRVRAPADDTTGHSRRTNTRSTHDADNTRRKTTAAFWIKLILAVLVAAIPWIGTVVIFGFLLWFPNAYGGQAGGVIGVKGAAYGGVWFILGIGLLALVQFPQRTPSGLIWVGTISGNAAPIVLAVAWGITTVGCWYLVIKGMLSKPKPRPEASIPLERRTVHPGWTTDRRAPVRRESMGSLPDYEASRPPNQPPSYDPQLPTYDQATSAGESAGVQSSSEGIGSAPEDSSSDHEPDRVEQGRRASRELLVPSRSSSVRPLERTQRASIFSTHRTVSGSTVVRAPERVVRAGLQ